MKKRIEIPAETIRQASEGVEFLHGGEAVLRIFSQHNQPFAEVIGMKATMKIRKASIHESLYWIFLDFNEHDPLHRVAIKYGGRDWDDVDALLRPFFVMASIPFFRRGRS
jgi:hypothetical protein